MPRYHNKTLGVTVNVPEEAIRVLGTGWERIGEHADAGKPPEHRKAPDETGATGGGKGAEAEGNAGKTVDTEPQHQGKRPAGNATRKQWADYAQSLGIDPGHLTIGELMKATEGK